MTASLNPTRQRGLIALFVLSALAACANTPKDPRMDAPLALAHVDLPRYMGTWYIVARVPYVLEKGLVGEKTHYALRDDGRVIETFSARKGNFDGEEKTYTFVDKPDPATDNAHWSVRLFWPIYVSQDTIYVDEHYEYTLIGHQKKTLGWIFARKPMMSDDKYRELLGHFAAQGYDTSTFRRVPQKPDEIGKPGFDEVN